jgi:nucleotide-binding universal stress UspA family protein
MFKHILVPTDGSRLAGKGVKAGLKLAAALGARVTALYVIMVFPAANYGEYRQRAQQAAKRALAAVEIEAQVLGVPCATRFVADPQPWGAILRVAHSRKCDAIAMSSHGRGGLGGLLLGSETQRVLAHSKIPVLVIR